VTEEETDTGVAGSFSFNFTTSEYSSDIVVSITAVDWNGNAGNVETRRLVYPGSTLPSLTVTPGNKQVTLAWEAVKTAEEYTVFYESAGTVFNESTAESFTVPSSEYDGTTPVVLTAAEHGITNNVLCSIRVKASSAGGEE